jgi:hypothetical protein
MTLTSPLAASTQGLRKSRRAAERGILALLAFAQTKEGQKVMREIASSRRVQQSMRQLRKRSSGHKLARELLLTLEKSR